MKKSAFLQIRVHPRHESAASPRLPPVGEEGAGGGVMKKIESMSFLVRAESQVRGGDGHLCHELRLAQEAKIEIVITDPT